MENFLNLLKDYEIYILIGFILITLILLFLVIILMRAVKNVESRYRKLMRGVNSKNLEELVIGYLDNVDKVKIDTEYIKEIYKDLDKRVKGCIQKTSMIRYRAFEDVGSDLSYSIALLDYNNDGVIVTGIYSRNDSTTYAKPIDKGMSRYDLSDEEQQVLKDAMSKK